MVLKATVPYSKEQIKNISEEYGSYIKTVIADYVRVVYGYCQFEKELCRRLSDA